MQPISFVHSADLHLDSPFKGLSQQSEAVGRALRRATFAAWQNILELCLERRVDFLVVAGDVYDGADRSLYAQLQFRDGVQRLHDAGIAVYVAHGNHDPLSGWASAIDWPERVHIFGSGQVEVVPHHRDGQLLCHLHGISYLQAEEQRNLARSFEATKRPGSPFDIGVLHCSVGTSAEHASYARCEVADLRAAAVDYWALGHVHRRAVLTERPYVVYPGNPQGRSIREVGPRGCMYVQVDTQGNVQCQPVDTDVVRWAQLTLSIDGLDTIDGLDSALRHALLQASAEAAGRDLLVRVHLRGRGALHADLRREGAVQMLTQRLHEGLGCLQPFVWVEQLTDGTRPSLDLALLAERDDLVGELARVTRDAARSPETLAAEVLGKVLASFEYREHLEPLTEVELLDLLEEACCLCIERLEVP